MALRFLFVFDSNTSVLIPSPSLSSFLSLGDSNFGGCRGHAQSAVDCERENKLIGEGTAGHSFLSFCVFLVFFLLQSSYIPGVDTKNVLLEAVIGVWIGMFSVV
jgi:hypothetical protein